MQHLPVGISEASPGPDTEARMGAYVSAAELVAAIGLNPLPVRIGEKVPAVRWKPWQEKHIPPGLVGRWRDDPKHADSNLASTTGGVTGRLVVDIDSPDPRDHAEAVARFGDSPVKVATPSGGLHLWFASPGGVPNAQKIDGTRVDIRGDGGIVVLPPSVRPEKGTYAFLEGDWADLGRLPLPRPGSLPCPTAAPPRAALGAFQARPGGVQRGQRNRALFDHLRAFAVGCGDEGDLAAEALRWSAELAEPLAADEALRVAGSVWGYKVAGTLMAPGGKPMVAVRASALDELDADALFLLLKLQREHAGVREEFAVSPPAMAASLKWTKPRLMAARDALLLSGYLVRTHQGGAGKHDPARFRFAS